MVAVGSHPPAQLPLIATELPSRAPPTSPRSPVRPRRACSPRNRLRLRSSSRLRCASYRGKCWNRSQAIFPSLLERRRRIDHALFAVVVWSASALPAFALPPASSTSAWRSWGPKVEERGHSLLRRDVACAQRRPPARGVGSEPPPGVLLDPPGQLCSPPWQGHPSRATGFPERAGRECVPATGWPASPPAVRAGAPAPATRAGASGKRVDVTSDPGVWRSLTRLRCTRGPELEPALRVGDSGARTPASRRSGWRRTAAACTGELTRGSSKQLDLIRRLAARLPDLTTEDRPPPASRARQLQRRLDKVKIEELISSYEAGQTIAALAMEYGVHPHTVSQHLKRAGVQLRQQGLTDEQKTEAERLYLTGRSLKAIAEAFDCDAETVRQMLKKRGVAMRHPWERI